MEDAYEGAQDPVREREKERECVGGRDGGKVQRLGKEGRMEGVMGGH